MPKALSDLPSSQRKTFYFPSFWFKTKTATKHSSKLRFDYELALHPAVADSATVAAAERVGSRCTRHKSNYRRSSLLDLEAVFLGTEEEVGITFASDPSGYRLILKLCVLSRDVICNCTLAPDSHGWAMECTHTFWRDFKNLYIPVRLRSIPQTGEASGDNKPAPAKTTIQFAIR
jgi:hypothetical protein